MAKLRGELSFYRHRLDQSPLSHALCDRGDFTSVVVQFRASVFHVTASALHSLDGCEQIGARFRSITTSCLFGLAAVVALKYPLVGLGICIGCLIVYLRPDPPGAGQQRPRSASR